jgi:exopolysaccharide biosynthesis polyprenyl glycosylphosphotransferase
MTTTAAVAQRSGLHRSEHRLLLTTGDAVVAVVALTVALRMWSITTGFPFSLRFIVEHAAWLIAVPLWLAVTGPTRAWNSAHALPRTVGGLLSAAGALAAFYVILYFYAPPSALARLPALYFLWEAVLLTVAWRLIYLFVLGRGAFTRRAVIVGDGTRAKAAREFLQREARDTVVVGFVSDGEQVGSIDGETIRPLSALDGLIDEGIAEVVLAIDRTPSPLLSERLLRLQERGLDVVPFAAEYEQRLQRVPIDHVDSDWAFQSLPEWVRARDASRLAKRVVDIAGSLVGMVIFAVLVVPVSIAVLIDDGRPVFFRQQRIGRGGKRFDVVKFRTMRVGAEAEGARWASPDDPRTTRVGRWLRRARLDEWPQVVNVLRGDMSLVGPRPERPEFTEQLGRTIPFYRSRLMVQPGLTGWAQVNADYGDSLEGQARKLEYDLYYLKHRSLPFDAWILLRTVGTVIGLRGH